MFTDKAQYIIDLAKDVAFTIGSASLLFICRLITNDELKILTVLENTQGGKLLESLKLKGESC